MSITTAVARVAALLAVVTTIGLLPWLSGRDAALSVLRARSPEQEATEEALAAIREDLGLGAGPLTLLGRWAGGLLRGDLGHSWVSGTEVFPSVLAGLGVSLGLMAASLAVALLIAVALCAPTTVRGARGGASDESTRVGRREGGGALAGMLAAVPEFLLATLLLIVLGVWAGLLPTSGWQGPSSMVLPALAMGVPAGGLLGRLVADALPAVFAERWVGLWRASGVSAPRVAAAALRRSLPALLPQFGLVAVSVTGGAVAVETVFAVPGIGRTALGAAKAQDLPLLQGAVLALLLVGLTAGALARLVRLRLIGPGLRDAALALPAPPRPATSGARRLVPAALGSVLLVTIGWGLTRDPLTVDVAARLATPSWAHPLGTDALGRDVLARLGHGAAATVGVALAVCLFSCLLAVAIGFLPEMSAGVADVANALPPVIVGVLVAAALGPGAAGASVAVALVSWPPLAAHAAALVQETRAAAFLTAQKAIGSTRRWVLTRHVLPSVAGPVARHAVLRLPGIALALASLGFLGLGAQPPSPEWGLLLDESRAYVERAPWAALAPAAALALLAGLAVSLSTLTPRGGRVRAGAAA
ncbi:ABC transporter permease subunit [Streptomyces alkaliterrae]|uniref:ABC transporter permease subunit n=1 Tax=Streptomyces alkaliterrae TaxID=2213162 RepID=A0A5P0YNE5_9ACTN|nr:ABC transporter permease subunit [Streptomyces alkaliterrae]MBB1257808.1 ABC transporter permease subunit [Streptomyces alkaliterrae]MQS01197.1 ABC transporter permease subunit [Streptomyces alkaliterrae]